MLNKLGFVMKVSLYCDTQYIGMKRMRKLYIDEVLNLLTLSHLIHAKLIRWVRSLFNRIVQLASDLFGMTHADV